MKPPSWFETLTTFHQEKPTPESEKQWRNSSTQHTHTHTEVAQLCPALCDPMDCSPPGSLVHGIFQAWTAPSINWIELRAFPSGSEVKKAACNAEDAGSIPWSGRYPAEGNDNPLQYSGLGNTTDRGAWRATVHRDTKESDIWEGLGPGKHHHLSSEILVIYPHTLPSFPSSFFLFYISMVFLVCSQVCAYPVITTVNLRTFSSLAKETPCPLAITPSIAVSNHQYIFYLYRYTYPGPFVYMESYTMGPFMSGFSWWVSGFPGSCCAPWNRCCLPDFVKIVWVVHYILHIPMHIGYFNNKSQTIKIKHKVQRACSSSVHLRLLFLKMLVLPILLHVAGLGEVPSQSPSPTEDNGR